MKQDKPDRQNPLFNKRLAEMLGTNEEVVRTLDSILSSVSRNSTRSYSFLEGEDYTTRGEVISLLEEKFGSEKVKDAMKYLNELK